MAYLASHFTNSLVFIYDDDNNFITKTVITGYDRDEMYIEVSKGLEKVKLKTRLNLLIIHSAGASELSGTLKSARQGVYEISIYGERQRDVRSTVRHKLNASAVISDMVTDSGSVALNDPLPVIVEDLSSTGILIRSQEMRFEVGAILQVEFEVHGKSVILYCEVLREQFHGGEIFKYGCKLQFLD